MTNLHALDDVDMRRMPPAAEAFVLRQIAKARRTDAALAQAALYRAHVEAANVRSDRVRAEIAAVLESVR